MCAKSVLVIVLTSSLVVTTGTVQAGWSDFLGDIFGELTRPADKEDATEISKRPLGQQEMIEAVLEALEVGAKRAITLLAKDGGYLNDQTVKILMPESLQQVDSLLRKLGQEKYADQFVTSMNRAAERAVPKTTTIVIDAIKKMSLTDARAILQGNDDAATQYLRQHTSDSLQRAIQPIVSEAMDEVGVTAAYKKMVGKADFLSSFMDKDSLDIDRYVTEKTLDGLFLKLAAEEARIRKDPVARSSELLKKVFAEFAK
jgi:hypothetical protein